MPVGCGSCEHRRWSAAHPPEDRGGSDANVVSCTRARDSNTSNGNPAAALTTLTACQQRFAPSEPVRFAPIEDEDPLYRVFDRDEIIDTGKARTILGWTTSGPTTTEFVQRVN